MNFKNSAYYRQQCDISKVAKQMGEVDNHNANNRYISLLDFFRWNWIHSAI